MEPFTLPNLEIIVRLFNEITNENDNLLYPLHILLLEWCVNGQHHQGGWAAVDDSTSKLTVASSLDHQDLAKDAKLNQSIRIYSVSKMESLGQ